MHSPSEHTIRLEALNRNNWELVASLEVSEDQKHFIPSNLWSIAQSKVEPLFPYAIRCDEEVVGFIMYGDFSGVCWISRIMVDKRCQGKGVGKFALRQILDMLAQKGHCREVRTSISQDNALAEYLFYSQGFRRIGEPVGAEIVMRLMR